MYVMFGTLFWTVEKLNNTFSLINHVTCKMCVLTSSSLKL